MKARYKSIVDVLAERIRNGDILPGTRLPTHRTLSTQEHISLATATRVYRELEAMGLVSGETGRGTFVREISLPKGHGIDQDTVASDVLDLNFNYPSLPGQGSFCVTRFGRWRFPGILNPTSVTNHMRAECSNGKLSRVILKARSFNLPLKTWLL